MNQPSSIFNLTNHEVYVVSTRTADQRWGFIATWVMPLTLMGEHRQFMVAISPHNSSWPAIATTKTFALGLLSTAQLHLVIPFGTRASSDQDKFLGQPLDPRASLPVLAHCVGFVEAKITAIHQSPQHPRQLVVAQTTHSFCPPNDKQPLTTGYLREHLDADDRALLERRRRKLAHYDTPGTSAEP